MRPAGLRRIHGRWRADRFPAGLSLSGGTISGTPTSAGPSSVTVKVTDSASVSASAALSLIISGPGLSVTTSSLPAGTVGVAYSQTLNATGGVPPYTWSISSGSVPGGLGLAGSTISGTPTTVGSSNFTVRVTDSASAAASAALLLTIRVPVLNITTSALPVGTTGVGIFTISQRDGWNPALYLGRGERIASGRVESRRRNNQRHAFCRGFVEFYSQGDRQHVGIRHRRSVAVDL